QVIGERHVGRDAVAGPPRRITGVGNRRAAAGAVGAAPVIRVGSDRVVVVGSETHAKLLAPGEVVVEGPSRALAPIVVAYPHGIEARAVDGVLPEKGLGIVADPYPDAV